MTATPYRILVTGSRDWSDPTLAYQALENIRRTAPEDRPLELVVGDCPTGADRTARQWATAAMVPIDAHLADWATHGKAAGPIRNAAMVAAGADLCLAFIKGGSRGASHTIALARRAGIPVQLWTAP